MIYVAASDTVHVAQSAFLYSFFVANSGLERERGSQAKEEISSQWSCPWGQMTKMWCYAGFPYCSFGWEKMRKLSCKAMSSTVVPRCPRCSKATNLAGLLNRVNHTARGRPEWEGEDCSVSADSPQRLLLFLVGNWDVQKNSSYFSKTYFKFSSGISWLVWEWGSMQHKDFGFQGRLWFCAVIINPDFTAHSSEGVLVYTVFLNWKNERWDHLWWFISTHSE